MPLTNFPNGVTSFGIPMVSSGVPIPNVNGKVLFVDGTYGTDGNKGTDPKLALSTIARAIALANPGDTIFVFPKEMAATDTDPGSYAEAITIDVPQVSLFGVARGRTQGGLPQIKKGSGTAALITVTAPGVWIAGLGINGSGSTGGGIKFSDDGGSTSASFGGAVSNCHFKNCVGSTATDSRTGGAIQLSGAPWQMNFSKNIFYKNVGGIVLLDTSNSAPQDIVIEENVFAGTAATVDCDIYLAGGSGADAAIVRKNVFACDTIPALGSGSVVRYLDMTGCTGMLVDNVFATTVDAAGTEYTFGAAGTAALIPTTVRMARNWGELSSATAGATGEIYRT